MWYAVSCKKRHLILFYENWSLVEYMKFSVMNGTHKCHRWGYSWLSEAIRCCKHPTESPHFPNPSFQSRMFTAPPGCQQWKSSWEDGPNDQFFTVLTLMWKQIIFPKNTVGDICFLLVTRILAVCRFPTWRLGGFRSSRGTMSIRKSNWSNFVMAMAMSFLCKHNRHRRSRDEVIL